MEKELKELQENVAKATAALEETRKDMDATIEKRVDEKLKIGMGELKDREDKIVKDMGKQYMSLTDAEKLQKRTELLEVNQKRISQEHETNSQTPAIEMYEAFILTAPTETESPELKAFMHEQRTMTENVDPSGGFTVPDPIATEMLHDIHEFSNVRGIARITTTTLKSYPIMRRVGIPTATRETETGSGSASQPDYKKIDIPVHPAVMKIKVSADLLEDSVVNLRSELQTDAVLGFATLEGEEFVNGDGVSEPEGFMVNGDVAIVNAEETVADTLEGDDFYTLLGGVKTGYRLNGRFVMNTNTWLATLKLVGSDGQYIWQSRFTDGAPSMIAGKPYTILDDMADVGDKTYPIVFGDFMQGYRIVDRTGMKLQVEDITSWPSFWFKFRLRNGGGVAHPEALVKLYMSK